MTPDTIDQLPTPSLVVERTIFDANVAAMSAAHPGASLRPHVKAFKSTALAKELVVAGHTNFCAATVREVEGMAEAGMGTDLLLANQSLDVRRLGALVEQGHRITVAIDSQETIDAAVAGGVKEVLVDVMVGMPRCGCTPDDAGRLADAARSAGLEVRGVMGYEGHLMMASVEKKAGAVEKSMADLLRAAEFVAAPEGIVSAGGTGTYAVNVWANEIQAGSYCLLDTDYAKLDSPFEIALTVMGTIISTNAQGWAVADAGLKSLGMDHGDPTWPGGDLFFVADEHTVLVDPDATMSIGDRVRLLPGHLDPTIARHREMWVVDGEKVVDCWPVDLRHW
ncbi:MAG: D-serine deaminase-like pyridoxal phosphate-dependent protein [Candidatus Aldehydirespiratoraceae bacterium]|jgi:D-serine deaminase-like pyridoxal phosphate-dependent protein